MTVVSARVSPEMKKEIEWYAKKEKVGKTVALRKILERGLKEVRTEHALEEYRDGKITLWKASDVAGLPLWEMIELVKKKEVPLLYTLKGVKEDINAVSEDLER